MSRWLLIPIFLCSSIVMLDYHFNPTGWYTLALFFLPLTIILTIVLMLRLPAHNPAQELSIDWQPFTRWHVLATIMGFACFVLMAQAQGTSPAMLTFLYGMPHAYQFALWLLGVGLITWGMAGGFPLRQGWQMFRRWTHEPDARWLLLIILLGLFLRVIWLESAVHYYTDESNFATAVVQLRTQSDVKIMNNIGSIANFAWIYPYLQTIYTELFGATLANLRAVSVIIGTLTIPALYLLGRWGFGRRIGLPGAFLLAIFLPHIHFSRLAMNNIADPLLGVLTIAFLWRGLQTGSRQMMAWAGVFLGLTGYFYEGGRLLYPALMISWLIAYAVLSNFKIPKRGVGVFLLTAMLITSGFYLSLAIRGEQRVAPRLANQTVHEYFWMEILTSSDTSGQVLRYLDERLNPPYLHIMGQPGGSDGFYYSRQVGLTLPHLLPFLLIGIGVAIFYGRQLGLIFPFWLMLTVLGNSLIIWNNWSPRFAVLFPALVLLMALGLDLCYRTIRNYWLMSSHAKRLWQMVGVLVLGWVAIGQVSFYFGVLLPDYNLSVRNEIDDQDVLFRAQLLSPETQVFMLGDARFHDDVEIIQAYEQHEVPVHMVRAHSFDFSRLKPDQAYAFFVLPNDQWTLRQLKQIFGDRLSGASWSPYNLPRSRQFALYQVNAQ